MLSQSYFRNATPVLRAKHTHPEVRHGLVDRQRLLDRLDRGLSRRLTLVVAPAGYGKTTILAQWLDSTERPSSWLSLDPLDNDLSTFAAYLLAAVRDAYPDAGENLAPLLSSPQSVPAEILADALIEDLATLPGSLVLVLDDFHYLSDDAVKRLMDRLVQFLPSNTHLVLCARSDSGLSLARLRSRGEVADIRATDLRFSVDESRRFLDALTGQRFDTAAAAMLEQQTEGWAITLQLAGLTMQEGESPASLAERFARHGHDYAANYLMEELFIQQPPDVRDFLQVTSILERLSESLCASVTGREDLHGTLDRLWQANQLIVPLDEERVWFRYHYLFRQFLRRRLTETPPAEGIDHLHQRASVWLAKNGLISEGISHAVSSNDLEMAVRLCESNFTQAMNHEQWWRVARWLDLLPDSVKDRPAILVAQGWLLSAHSKPLLLAEVAERAERQLASALVAPAQRRVLQAQINAQKAFASYWTGDVETSLALARSAVAGLEPHLTWALGIAYLYTGVPLFVLGQPDEAIAQLQSIIDAHAEADDVVLARVVMGQCLVFLETGNLPALKRAGQIMGKLALRSQLQNSAGWAAFVEGYVAYESNDLVQAEKSLRKVVDSPHAFNSRTAYESQLTLALTLLALGRFAEADALAAQLREFLVASNNLQAMPLVEALEYRLALVQEIPLNVGPGRGLTPAAAMLDVRLSFVVSPWLARVHCLLREGTPDALHTASEILGVFRKQVELLHLDRRKVEVLALQALSEVASGNTCAALDTLRQCLQLAEPGRLVRTIVDCGPALIPLLESLRANGFMTKYIDRILGALTATTAFRVEETPIPETVDHAARFNSLLTYREEEVLGYLAQRLSDKEIAARLVVAPNTVKKYTAHIYRKLGVNNRRAAVSAAERLGLIPTR